jgi:hypothetical protein
VTVRDLFRRRRTRRHRIVVPLGVVLTIAWVIAKPHQTRLQALEFGLVLAAVLIVILLPITKSLFSCPRCGTSFRKYRIGKLGRFSVDARPTEDLWDACPQCGLRFDAPIT